MFFFTWFIFQNYDKSSSLLNLQPDQINMTVFFWYLVKSDLSSIRYCTLTSHFLQGKRKTRSCLNGHPVLYWYGCSRVYVKLFFSFCVFFQRQYRRDYKKDFKRRYRWAYKIGFFFSDDIAELIKLFFFFSDDIAELIKFVFFQRQYRRGFLKKIQRQYRRAYKIVFFSVTISPSL